MFEFYKQFKECNHSKIPTNIDETYCPDCGKHVKNKWFLIRCKCCNIKREGILYYGNIVPKVKFCKNCGSHEYYITELDDVNCVDVNYAILKRIIIDDDCSKQYIQNQIWVDDNKENITPKLLGIIF